MIFRDRSEAGKLLGQKLQLELTAFQLNEGVVLGLPRGGVVLANEVARLLHLPLDIIVTRKIGAPFNPEYALGAINEEGDLIMEREDERYLDRENLNRLIENEKSELVRRLKLYRGNKAPLNLKGKVAILVDDGVATGATMMAAARSAKKKGAARVVVAVPVISKEALERLQFETDKIIFLHLPDFLGAVGAFYLQFDQVTDQEVITFLK